MDYRITVSLTDLQAYLASARLVSFDFETAPLPEYRDVEKAALDAHKSHIVGISVSVEKGAALYIPLRHMEGPNADPAEIMGFLHTALFENPDVVKIAHNLAFESMFLYALGIVVQPPCYDTIAAAQLTLKGHNEFRGLKDSGLKPLSAALLGVATASFEKTTGGRHFDELPSDSPEAVQYACADSDYTLQLYHRFNDWFDRYLPKHRYIVEEVESPTAVYCGLMKFNGLLVDVEAMRHKQGEALARMTELRAAIAAIIGDVDIGANASTSAFKKHLFDTLGLPVLKTTAKYQEVPAGLPSADDETMILLAEWCGEHRPELVPLFEYVQEYRKLGKISATYIEGYLRHLNPATGRIHPDLMPLATETGRFAARNPNVQNQVSPGNDPIGVRNFVVAPDDYVLLEADYSQVELRIAAYLSRDGTMLTAYENGADIHAITTGAVFDISLEEASDKHHPDYKHRRTVAKSTMFGILYGIYAKGLMRNLKVSAGVSLTEAECREYIAGIKARYRRLAAWQQESIARAKKHMHTETALGRRRYLPGICSPEYAKRGTSERMAINTPVQGLAADCLKLAMGRLVAALVDKPYIRPLMTVHDSLVFEVRADKAEEAVELVTACMEASPPLEGFMPLVAEVSIGTKYGELA